jgi:cytoskeletal protein RodZ
MNEKPLQPLCAIVVVASSLATGAAFAQSAHIDPSYTDLSTYLLVGGKPVPTALVMPSPATGGNFSDIAQVGQNNVATVNIQGAGNSTTQIQSGAFNASTLAVTGDLDHVATTQIGSSDSVSLTVTGQGNTVSDMQVGVGLSYSLTQIGNGGHISVQQIGAK